MVAATEIHLHYKLLQAWNLTTLKIKNLAKLNAFGSVYMVSSKYK